MKRTIFSVFFSLFVIVLGSLSVWAVSDIEFTTIEVSNHNGFKTIITDVDGKLHTLNGVVDGDKLASNNIVSNISSYSIYFNEEEILCVELNNISAETDKWIYSGAEQSKNGYYAVEFPLRGGSQKAYITGLTKNNVESVRNEIVSAKLTNSEFYITDADFIDAEKLKHNNGADENLCWAASTANMLEYSGWANKAVKLNPLLNFNGEDSLFEVFIDNFKNAGGNQVYGLEWFFNGSCSLNDALKKTSGGGYLKDYFWENLVDNVIFDSKDDIATVLSALRNGDAIGTNVSWVNSKGERDGGHAITMWGYIYDSAKSVSDMDYMKALIITDSDSDKFRDADRELSVNKMHVLNMSKYNSYTWKLDSYTNQGNIAVLEMMALLKSYDDKIPYETDPSATRKTNGESYEFSASDLKITTDVNNADMRLDSVSSSDKFAVMFYMKNYFDKMPATDVTCRLKITNKESGDSVADWDMIVEDVRGYAMYGSGRYLSNLQPGEYSAEIIVNSDKALSEAFYYNNKKTIEFTVKGAPIKIEDVEVNLTDYALNDNVSVINNTGKSCSFVPILALYTSDGRLIGMDVESKRTLDTGYKTTVNFEINSTAKIPKDSVYKIYLWNNIYEMIPIEFKQSNDLILQTITKKEYF